MTFLPKKTYNTLYYAAFPGNGHGRETDLASLGNGFCESIRLEKMDKTMGLGGDCQSVERKHVHVYMTVSTPNKCVDFHLFLSIMPAGVICIDADGQELS